MIIRRFLAVFFFFTISTFTWGQGSGIDSLEAFLKELGRDTHRVNTLLDLSAKVFRLDPDQAIIYSREADDLSRELGFQKGQAYALKNIGLAYYIKGNYNEVLNNWEQSLEIFQYINDQLGVSNLLSNLGAVYFNQGDYTKALELYLESLRVSEKLGNKLRIATALTNIGAVYFESPLYYDKARDYYQRAITISEEIGNDEAIGTSSVNLGEIYMEKDQLDSALFYFQKALAAHNNSGAEAAYVLNNIGKVHAISGDYQEALKFQTRALKESQKVESILSTTQSLNGLGNSHLELGSKGNDAEEFSKALSYFEDAYEKALAEDIKPELERSAKGLYTLYKIQGNYPRSLQYLEVYESVKDTLLNQENIKKLALIGAEYEYEKEKQQLEFELDTNLRKQRSIQYAIGAGLLVALIFIAILLQYYRLKRIRAAEKFEAQRQLIIQDKLASLGQITAGIAHEIKNPLNFITNFAEGSVEFGDELLGMLKENEQKLGPEEFENLQDLAYDLHQNAQIIQENGLRADRVVSRMMEQARGDKGEPQKVDINTLVDENLHLAYHGYRGVGPGFTVNIEKDFEENLPPVELIPQDIGRVILNIFNNACFALNEKQKRAAEGFEPTIWVSTRLESGKVGIRLRDNGPGIPEKIREKIFNPFFTTKPTGEGNTGLGLSISHDLIVIGHNGELEVDSKEGEYSEFLIRLPIERPSSIMPKPA